MAGEKHLIEERVKAGESSSVVNGKMESFFSPLLLLPFFSLSLRNSLSLYKTLSLSSANPIQVRFPIPKFFVFSSFFFVPSIYVFFAHCSNLFNFSNIFKNFAFLLLLLTLSTLEPNNNWYYFCFSDCFYYYVIVVVCFINLSLL